MIELVEPAFDYLPQYKAALEKNWSPDNIRLEKAAKEELEKIARDPKDFIEKMTDFEATGGPITMPDGSVVPRLPGFRRWIWDGEFCGSIGFRWQKGTSALPPYALGHIGYAVVPWKRRLGCATQGLELLLACVRKMNLEGLRYVLITAEPDNLPSQKVILANGGFLAERFEKPEIYGGGEFLRYRIDL